VTASSKTIYNTVIYYTIIDCNILYYNTVIYYTIIDCNILYHNTVIYYTIILTLYVVLGFTRIIIDVRRNI